MTPFLLLGWLCFALFSWHGRAQLAGLSLGLLLIKPQMLVLIVPILVWKKQWATLSGLATVAVPLVVISLLVAGPVAAVSYPAAVLHSTTWNGVDGVNNELMLGWLGIASRYIGDELLARTVAAALGIMTVAVVGFSLRGQWSPKLAAWDLQLALIIGGTLLINPHFWLQDAAQLAVIVGLAVRFAQRTGQSVAPWAAAFLVLVFVQSYHHQWIQLHRLNLITPAIAVLFVMIAVRAARDVHGSAALTSLFAVDGAATS